MQLVYWLNTFLKESRVNTSFLYIFTFICILQVKVKYSITICNWVFLQFCIGRPTFTFTYFCIFFLVLTEDIWACFHRRQIWNTEGGQGRNHRCSANHMASNWIGHSAKRDSLNVSLLVTLDISQYNLGFHVIFSACVATGSNAMVRSETLSHKLNICLFAVYIVEDINGVFLVHELFFLACLFSLAVN